MFAPSQMLIGYFLKRFVEEQEPYDTGSDSENDVPAKKSPKKSWIPSMWFAKKSDQNPVA